MKKKTKKMLKNNIKNVLIVGLIFLTLLVVVLAANWVNPASNNPGLLSFFHFNGNDLTDSVGNNGFSTGNESFATGKYLTGLNITQMKEIHNSALSGITQYGNLTIEFWYKYETVGGGQQNFIFAGSSTEYLTIYQTGNTITIQSAFPGGGFKTRGTAINQWTHVAMVWKNGNSLTMYLNGTNVSETTGGNAVDWQGEPFKLGHPTQATGTNITIDSLLIWNVTRTGAEILSDMAGANNTAYIKVRLLFPTNSSDIIMGNFLNFSGSLTSSIITNLTNATLQIWDTNGVLKYSRLNNLTGVGITNITNYTLNVDVGNYKWNILGCGNKSDGGSICDSQTSNFTFRVGFKEREHTFSTPVIESSNQGDLINITYDNTYFDSISATLFYNGSTKVGSNVYSQGNNKTYRKTFTIPNVNSQQNIPLYWQFQLTNSTGSIFFFNSTTQTQTVTETVFELCAGNGQVAVNFTLHDEETNISRQGDFNATFKWRYNFNQPNTNSLSVSLKGSSSYSFCITTNNTHIVDFDLDLQSVGYPLRNFGFRGENYTNVTIHQPLYLLNNSVGTNMIIDLKDSGLIRLPNHEIKIFRKSFGQVDRILVENDVTDDLGQIVARLVEDNVIYEVEIYDEDDALIKTLDRAIFTCRFSICQIQIIIDDNVDNFAKFDSLENYESQLTFSNATNNFVFTWSDSREESSSHRLLVTRFSFNGSVVVCNMTSSDQISSLSCSVGNKENSYQAQGYRKVDGNERRVVLLDVKVGSPSQTYGLEGLIWSFALLITMLFVGYFYPPIGVGLYVIGYLFLGFTGIVYITPAIAIAQIALGVLFIWAFRG